MARLRLPLLVLLTSRQTGVPRGLLPDGSSASLANVISAITYDPSYDSRSLFVPRLSRVHFLFSRAISTDPSLNPLELPLRTEGPQTLSPDSGTHTRWRGWVGTGVESRGVGPRTYGVP